MKTLILAAMLAVAATLFCFSGTAAAQETTCSWQIDEIEFTPETDPVYDVDTNTDTCSSHGRVMMREYWKIIIQPGYMFGYAEAWEDITYCMRTGKADISKDYNRTSYYNVVSSNTCMTSPPHSVSALSNASWYSTVTVDQPGLAEVSGITTIEGTLTDLWVQAADAVAAGDGDTAEIEFKVQKNGAEVTVKTQVHYGADTKSSSTAGNDQKTAAVLDEEYIIYTKLKIDAEGDAHVLNWFGLGRGKLYDHYIYIKTDCSCTNCGAAFFDAEVINKDDYGVTE